jgi:hypothetical protein
VTAEGLRVQVDAPTTRLLRLYRGQRPDRVIARAMRMLATADGLLTPDGRIKGGPDGRRSA